MKKAMLALLSFCLLWALSGCLSVPELRKAYVGPAAQNEQISRFYMPQGWDFKLILFKVDGKTAPDYYPKSISYTDWKGGFNVAVLPGSHAFELALQEENCVCTVSFSLEGGAAYELQYDKKNISVVKKTAEGDKTAAIKQTIVAPYKEPDKTAPHGTIVQTEDTLKNGRLLIFRVDGLPGTYVPAIGASIFPIANSENFKLRLSPGKHVIDYTFHFKNFRSITFLSKEITIEAGKKYKMQIGNSSKIGNDITLSEVEFVSY